MVKHEDDSDESDENRQLKKTKREDFSRHTEDIGNPLPSSIPTSPISKNDEMESHGTFAVHNSSSQSGEVEREKKRKKFKQTYLAIGSSPRTTCQQCNMSYYANIKSDVSMHQKFHSKATKGKEWNSKWGQRVAILKVEGVQAEIITIDPTKKNEVNATEEILSLANLELNAPVDTQAWKHAEKGKVFICVCQKRAVGIVSVERVTSGQWMVIDTGSVVPKQSVKLLLGVSRIYVARDWRRKGIAMKLLSAVMNFGVYGIQVQKLQIGFSQPSTYGSLLACRFNGVKHKSGKTLVPVYIESE